MERQFAIDKLDALSRNSVSPSMAQAIAEAFGCKLNAKLIRTELGSREINYQEKVNPRVDISSLALDICEQLNVIPDKATMKVANQMSGEGSYHDLVTKSCTIILRRVGN